MKKFCLVLKYVNACLFAWLLLIGSQANAFAQLAVPDHSKTYSPQYALNSYTDNGQGCQTGKQYKSDSHERVSIPPSLSIENGKTPPDHVQGAKVDIAKTNPNGQPIITRQVPDPNNAETAVKSMGDYTWCVYNAQRLFPHTETDRQPYWRHGGTIETPLAKRNAVDGAVNQTMHSVGNNVLGKGVPGVEPSGYHAQSGMTLTQSSLATLVGGIGDQIRQQVSNPAAVRTVAQGVQQFQNMQNADNQGNACRSNCASSFEMMSIPLINVANEEAASPCSTDQAFKTEANVVWMVQKMYKHCYLPMAILFLLPGAVLTQAKSLVSYSFLGSQDEDTSSPFIGIIRAIGAIFLIPATQLVVSYCIDAGNALTDPIAKQIHYENLMLWVNEQAYASDPKNNDGSIKIAGGNPQGKIFGVPAESVVQERQPNLTVGIQNWMNSINNMMSVGLEVLNGFQFVMMCYLFLLGPIAAALYAWPSGVGRDLFKKSFASWLDGVFVLSLWKFWWCIVLLCMAIRLGDGVDSMSQFEMYYFTAFMAILVVVPFQPFEFRPGDIVGQVLEKAQQHGGGGGKGGGGGGAGSGGASHGQQQSAGHATTGGGNTHAAGSGGESPHNGTLGASESKGAVGELASASGTVPSSETRITQSPTAQAIGGNVPVQISPPPLSNV